MVKSLLFRPNMDPFRVDSVRVSNPMKSEGKPMKSLKVRILIAGTLSLLLYGAEAFASTWTAVPTGVAAVATAQDCEPLN